jgi:hypothetical protein
LGYRSGSLRRAGLFSVEHRRHVNDGTVCAGSAGGSCAGQELQGSDEADREEQSLIYTLSSIRRSNPRRLHLWVCTSPAAHKGPRFAHVAGHTLLVPSAACEGRTPFARLRIASSTLPIALPKFASPHQLRDGRSCPNWAWKSPFARFDARWKKLVVQFGG